VRGELKLSSSGLVTKKAVLEYLGWTDTERISGDKVAGAIQVGDELTRPKGRYCQIDIDEIYNDEVVLKGGIGLSSKSLVSVVEGARSLVVFLVTIGSELENRAANLEKEGDFIKSRLLDGYGSEKLMLETRSLQKQVKQEVEDAYGYQMSHRYCPGYGDWPTTELKKLFSIVNHDEIDVSLTKSSMMKPRKSHSGVWGIGPEVKTKYKGSKFHRFM
ncbi:hypothetical protein KGY79_02455, partial [Candidatus Bipolaricaulota bacterium]|nr:hypothetical protein [Candidatus Bipolaricaulota bacterium]